MPRSSSAGGSWNRPTGCCGRPAFLASTPRTYRSKRLRARSSISSASKKPCSDRKRGHPAFMSVVLDRRTALLPGRFEFLMGLYAENYHRLTRLFAPQKLTVGDYVSDVDDGLP